MKTTARKKTGTPGRNLIETGKVREIKGKLIIIAPDKSAACFGCMNTECKPNGGLITAENPLDLPVETGWTVELRVPGISLASQALTAFLFPILGFIAGFFIIRRLFPEAGEGAAAAMGVIFLFVSAFVVYRARKKFPASRASVTAIIDTNLSQRK
jgi:sigma-E factor negative regulatory protein RseC